MRPSLPNDDIRDRSLVNRIPGGNFDLTICPGRVIRPDADDEIGSKSRLSVLGTAMVAGYQSALRNAVCHIVGLRPRKQVRWTEASLVVTAMTNNGREASKGQIKCDPVRAVNLCSSSSIAQTDTRISVAVKLSSPLKAWIIRPFVTVAISQIRKGKAKVVNAAKIVELHLYALQSAYRAGVALPENFATQLR